MVIGDARTQTFVTSQPPPEAPRPKIIGLLNGPIQWGDTMWAAMSWDTMVNWPPRTRGEAFLHESFHVVQRSKGIAVPDPARIGPNTRSENEHLDAVDGRYWLRLEWRALARALRESGEPRAQAVREALAFRQARLTRYPDHVVSEYVYDITEGLASYTQTVLAAPSTADAIARALELLAGAEDGESFVRTYAYTSGPAYGLLLDAASPGWPRRMTVGDEPAVLLMRALAIQPVADAETIYFGPYRMSGPWGTLEADKGVLITSDGRVRRLPAPVGGDGTTISGDGWTFKAAAGWVIREGARKGDYEVVKQP